MGGGAQVAAPRHAEVFDVACRWYGSEDPLMRARGIDVLAQLGKTPDHRMNSFPDESYSAITNLLKDAEDQSATPLGENPYWVLHGRVFTLPCRSNDDSGGHGRRPWSFPRRVNFMDQVCSGGIVFDLKWC